MLRYIYIYIVLFESCEGLYLCVESPSNKFDSEVESFLRGLIVGYTCDFLLNSMSVLKIVFGICTISD